MRFFLVSLTLCLSGCEILGTSNSHRRFHYGQKAKMADIFFAPLMRQPPFTWLPLEYVCGGTWIHTYYVLTTAYCLKYHDIGRVGYLTAQRKSWQMDMYDAYLIDQIHYFGNYSFEGDKSFEHDIGLIHISLRYGKKGHPSKVFPSIFNGWGNPGAIEKDQVVLFGFGRTESGNYAPDLKYMKGRLHFWDSYSKKQCNIAACNEGLSFCFEAQGAKERADNGDMGSPVYYKLENPDHPKVTDRVIIGVLSDYHKDPRNIILTNVTNYQGWIDSIIHK